MRIKFWNEPLNVKLARLGSTVGGIALSSMAIQNVLTAFLQRHHHSQTAYLGFFEIIIGFPLILRGVTGEWERFDHMRIAAANKRAIMLGLPIPERGPSESERIDALRNALHVDPALLTEGDDHE